MISVLLPSRGRPELLARSVASLRDLAAAPAAVTVHVGADDDDPATIAAAAALAVPCLAGPRRGYAGLHVYYQQLAALARGDWLLVWNDDAVMLTEAWDTVIEALPPRVLIADLQSHHSPMCCFPAVRRAAVDAVGRFCSDNPHVDTFWQDVGHAAGAIMPVPVRVRHEQDTGHAGFGATHGFYEYAHQAQLAAAAAVLRETVAGRGES